MEADDLEKVNSLLAKKGVCPTKLNPQGQSVLHLAATQGKLDMVNEMLSNKADIRARDAQGRFPLHCAARHGNGKVVQRLIQVDFLLKWARA